MTNILPFPQKEKTLEDYETVVCCPSCEGVFLMMAEDYNIFCWECSALVSEPTVIVLELEDEEEQEDGCDHNS